MDCLFPEFCRQLTLYKGIAHLYVVFLLLCADGIICTAMLISTATCVPLDLCGLMRFQAWQASNSFLKITHLYSYVLTGLCYPDNGMNK